MHSLLQHARYAVRMLLRTPSFTLAAIACLALGIGATTAIFSVVYAVVMKPLPYAASDRMVRIYSEFPNFPGGGLRKFWLSAPEYFDVKREVKNWESIDGWVNGGANLAGNNEPIRVQVSFLTGGMMPAMGISPIFGRLVDAGDDRPGKPLVAVISYGLWQRAFAGDRGILGRNTHLNGNPCTVIGVMPKDFQFPPGEVDAPELWTPLQLDPSAVGNRGGHFLSIIGKVKPGISIKVAEDELARLVNQWGALGTKMVHKFAPDTHPLVYYPLQEDVVGAVRPAMLIMLAAVGFVLLIACVNVANLLLARAEARQREIAVRKALGASAAELVKQFVVEGVLLSLAGAALGVGLAFGGLRLIVNASSGAIPRSSEIAIDFRVLLFTLAICICTGLFFGLAPMAQAMQGKLSDALKAAAGRTTASQEANLLRRIMVVAEVSLALVLLIGTGLMVRAFWKLQAVNAGVNPHGLLTMRVALPQSVYADNYRLIQFWSTVQERLTRFPGVTSATMMSGMPPIRQVNANDTSIEGFVPRPKGPIQSVDYYQTVGKNFFETMGIRLVEGRFFDERDNQTGPPTVIINQTMARTFWPNESAIGHRVLPGGTKDYRTVVGVAGDVKNAGVDKPTGTELFLPYRQTGGFGLRNPYVVVRTEGDPLALAMAARTQIGQIDSSLPIAAVRTMDDVMLAAQSRPRFLTLLLSMFSGVALVLAGVGIYGVISYSVEQRVNEFGIRMALGAEPANVLGMVIRQGFLLAAMGVAIGAVGALWLTRFIRGLLFAVDPLDPLTFLVMAGVLLAVTLLACYIPARRATRLNPVAALRYE